MLTARFCAQIVVRSERSRCGLPYGYGQLETAGRRRRIRVINGTSVRHDEYDQEEISALYLSRCHEGNVDFSPASPRLPGRYLPPGGLTLHHGEKMTKRPECGFS